MKKYNIHDLNHRELQSKLTGEKYSYSAMMTDVFGFKDLFVHHEIIPPGRRSSGPHFHSRREEMVYVLDGKVTALCNGESAVLEKGDFIGIPPGKDNLHSLKNESDVPAQILVIASNPEKDQVVYG